MSEPRNLTTWIECSVVFAVTAAFYGLLYSELPVSDTARFTTGVGAGDYQWDATHLFMQPATVLWHKYLSFGGDALRSQHHINTFCAALSLAIFWRLLARLGTAFVTRILLTLIATTSYSVLNLATSGHMKLTVLPFLSLALYYGLLWERQFTDDPSPFRHSMRRITASALALGMASLLLINSLAVLPFQCLAVLLKKTEGSHSNKQQFTFATTYGMLCLLVIAAGFVLVYFIHGSGFYSGSGPVAFFVNDLWLGARPGDASLRFVAITDTLARFAHGTLLAFVRTGDLGPILGARMQGLIPSLIPYTPGLLWESLSFIAILVILGWVYIRGAVSLQRSSVWSAWAFLAGISTFNAYWNLAEPEFLFQLVLPTLVIAAGLTESRIRQTILIVWVVITVGSNVVMWAIPKKLYPFQSSVLELQETVQPGDLLVGFRMNPGKPRLEFFLPYLPNRRVLMLDDLILQIPDDEAFLAEIRHRVDKTIENGGRAFVFRIFDEQDWGRPWPMLSRHGLPKKRLIQFFGTNYTLRYGGRKASIHFWELN